MRGVLSAILVFEAIVVGLAIPVAVSLSDVRAGVAAPVGLGVAVACLATAGLLRWTFGRVIGSALQVVALATGLVVPAMWVLGAVFGFLWFFFLVLDRRLAQAAASRP